VFKKSFTADFKMRSQKKVMDIFHTGLALFWTFLLIDSNDDETQNQNILVGMLLWMQPITSLLLYFVYKKKKPVTIFIKDDELIINNRWLQTRNLMYLIRIDESTFKRELNLNFKGKSEVSIPIKEYRTEDLQEFLKIIIAKSEQSLDVSTYILNTYKNISEEDA
jgi:hypothetical protein